MESGFTSQCQTSRNRIRECIFVQRGWQEIYRNTRGNVLTEFITVHVRGESVDYTVRPWTHYVHLNVKTIEMHKYCGVSIVRVCTLNR